MDATLLADTRYVLGEGSIWHAASSRLLHVDIEGKTVGLLDPESGDLVKLAMPSRVGTVVPVDGDASSAVVCLETGAYKVDLTGSTAPEQLSDDPEPSEPQNRFNDGKCDPSGRLWAGTMRTDPPRTPHGTLYRFDKAAAGRLVAVPVERGVSISNGIVWTADGKCMFYIDTPTGRIDAFDYDASTGEASNRRVAFAFDEATFPGHPDGCTLDSDGRLWTAHFGGGQVTCVDLETGTLVARVRIPGGVTNVTSVAFGGADMSDLFITTAREGLSDEELAEQPTAGGIFVARGLGARGVAPSCIRLD